MPNVATAPHPLLGGSRANAEPARVSITRNQLLAIARTDAPSQFLPLAARALDQLPHDAELRFLFAANLAKLGLRTLAAEQLNAMPPEAGNHPSAHALRQALSGLPDDRIDPESLAGHIRGNAEALASRGMDISPGLARWHANAQRQYFRRLDGALVRRASPDAPASSWRGMGDELAAARSAAASIMRPDEIFTRPVVIDGVNPPYTLAAVWQTTRAGAVGYAPRISIVAEDPDSMLDGIALLDLTPIISDPRVEWFVGPGATDRFREAWLPRLGCSLPESIVSTSGAVVTDLAVQLQNLHDRQSEELANLDAAVAATYRPRTPAWWAARFAPACLARTPLRVLVLTSRFTTYVRHAAADLARAFERAGHAAIVCMEPDVYSLQGALGTLRHVAEFQPDLFVLINFTRASCGAGVPQNLPMICWIQDAMPHMFDAAGGRAQGPLDFLAGHLFPELFEKFGYDPANAMPVPVVADGTKFRSDPQSTAGGRTHDCEIALVSHHSESPEAMRDRLVQEAGHAPAIKRVFERLENPVREAVAACRQKPLAARLRDVSHAQLRDVLGREPEARTLSLVLRTFALPLADRILRHETIGWAASIARRRNWRLHLYGKGWETNTNFATFARGELSHGESLRDAYRHAAVSLHVSAHSLVHQRVLECFLSGGLCACRMHADAIAGPKSTVQCELLEREPDHREEPGRGLGYIIADHAHAMSLASLRARLGMPLTEPCIWISSARAESMRRQGRLLALEMDLDRAVGDMAAVTFGCETEFESLVERAIENHAWRSATSTMARTRIARSLTHDALVPRLLDFVAGRLKQSADLREAA